MNVEEKLNEHITSLSSLANEKQDTINSATDLDLNNLTEKSVEVTGTIKVNNPYFRVICTSTRQIITNTFVRHWDIKYDNYNAFNDYFYEIPLSGIYNITVYLNVNNGSSHFYVYRNDEQIAYAHESVVSSGWIQKSFNINLNCLSNDRIYLKNGGTATVLEKTWRSFLYIVHLLLRILI